MTTNMDTATDVFGNESEMVETFNPLVPKHLPADYVEMAYLATLLAVGLPLNLYVFYTLCKSMMGGKSWHFGGHHGGGQGTKGESVRNGFLLMKINLNLSDLLLLVVICVGKLAWFATYEWKGGSALCKLFNFLSMTAMYISSNIIVCIALDRFRNVMWANRVRRHAEESVRNMLIVAWALSILWSLPQLYVWTAADVFPELGGFTQCTDIWSLAHKFGVGVDTNDSVSANETITSSIHQPGTAETLYHVSHMLLVFWLPLLVLIVAYLAIAVRLVHYSLKAPTSSNSAPQRTAQNAHRPPPPVATNTTSSSNRRSDRSAKGSNVPLLLARVGKQQPAVGRRQQGYGTLGTPGGSVDTEVDSHSMMPTNCSIKLENVDCVTRHDDHGIALLPVRSIAQLRNGSLTTVDEISSNQQSTHKNSKPALLGRAKSHSSLADLRSSNSPAIHKKAPMTRRPSNLAGSVRRRSVNIYHTFAVAVHLARSGEHSSELQQMRSAAPPTVRPNWRRRHLRSRVFRTTMLVVFAHVLLWLPYNVFALSKYVSPELHARLNLRLNIFKDLQLLITLVNPFLYGFSS